MKIVTIPKRNGKLRTIYCPDDDERKRSKKWIKTVQGIILKQPNANVIHGFMPGRSPVTNAMAHIGWHFTLSLDLKDFFDSVTPSHVANLIGYNDALSRFIADFIADCFFEGAARQGLPSSPAIANLAACEMDNLICKLIKRSRLGYNFTYTRYADDLTFSFDHHGIGLMLLEKIPPIASACGFQINQDKTCWQCDRVGRRIITGVAVDRNSIHPTRDVKRRLRAARHQMANGLRRRGRNLLITKLLESKRRGGTTNFKHLLINGHDGLKEWSRLKIPDDYQVYGNTIQSHIQRVTNATNKTKKQVATFVRHFRKLIID